MSQHVFEVSTTSMHTWSQMVTPASMMFWSKSKQVCVKCFRRSSMSWIFVLCTIYCITPLPHISRLYLRNMMTLVYFDDAMIHRMQFSLVISRCNITFSVLWFSQGSEATLNRWGAWSSYCHLCRSFLNLTLKTALKSVDFDKVTDKNMLAPFYGKQCSMIDYI